MQVDTTRLGLEAQDAQRRPFASMGIYVFKYEQLEQLLREDPKAVDFGKHVIPAAIHSRTCRRTCSTAWEDIGTIGAFYRANLDLTTKIPKFNLFDAEAPVYTRARYLPPSKIEESEINDSIVSDGHHQRREDHKLCRRFARQDFERRAARCVVHHGRRLLSDVRRHAQRREQRNAARRIGEGTLSVAPSSTRTRASGRTPSS